MYGPKPPPELVSSEEPLPKKKLGMLVGHRGPVLAIRLTRDGSYCLSCGKDRTIRLWNPHKQLPIMTYEGHGYEIRDVCIEADNSKFVSCGGDKQIFLWDVSAGKPLRKFRGHESEVNSVSYSTNCNVVVSGGYDQTVRVWDCRSRSIDPIQVMKECQDSVMSVAALESTDIIAGSVDGTVRRFDVRMGDLITDLVHHPVTSVTATNDCTMALVSCTDGCVRLLDMGGGHLLGTYKGHVHRSSKIESAFTPSEASIVSCSEDGRIVYWDMLDSSIQEEFQAHGSVVTGLAMHPQGRMLLTSSVDATVGIWVPE